MNPKIDKLANEIEKTKQKIAELQAKQRELEKQKTELENTDIVALVRSRNLSPQELAAFLNGRQAGPAPENGAGFTPRGLEDGEDEN